jgi:hypothetical protein
MLNDQGNGSPLFAQFGPFNVDTDSVLVKYTLNGDMDLNGVLDADDYFQIDNGFAKGAQGYRDGDLNYSQSIDADDYFLLDLAFATQDEPQAASGISVINLLTGKSEVMDKTGILGIMPAPVF